MGSETRIDCARHSHGTTREHRYTHTHTHTHTHESLLTRPWWLDASLGPEAFPESAMASLCGDHSSIHSGL